MALYIDGVEVLSSIVMHGTWTASGTVTLPAITLGGTVSGNAQNVTSVAILAGATDAPIYIQSDLLAANTGIGLSFRTHNAGDADAARITITSGVNTAVINFALATITGMVLSGPFNMNAQNMVSGAYHFSISGTDFNLAETGIADRFQVELSSGNVNTVGVYKVAATQIVGARVVDAAIDDAINAGAWDATTAGVLTAIRDAIVTHGLVAAA